MPMQSYNVTGYYRVKVHKKYPAPCEPEPNRLYEIFTDDVLTKDEKRGTYTIHTGLMLMGIVLADNEVEFVPGTAQLVGV